jgi:hypothetical protein
LAQVRLEQQQSLLRCLQQQLMLMQHLSSYQPLCQPALRL